MNFGKQKIKSTKGCALITGASSGIGAEFARQLAKQGYKLILTARRKERLENLAEQLDTDVTVIPADISSEENCYALMDELADRKISVFINCAGFGACGEFIEIPLQTELQMIDVNVKAVHILTKLMLQKMQAQGGGYILNVASSAGLVPAGPYMATYYATKAYVTSLTRAIAQELKEAGSPVHISALCPGPVDTEFNSVADVEFAAPAITPRSCVRYALRQMRKGKTVIVPLASMRLAVAGGRLLPQSRYIQMTGGIQKKKLRGRTQE